MKSDTETYVTYFGELQSVPETLFHRFGGLRSDAEMLFTSLVYLWSVADTLHGRSEGERRENEADL